MLSFFVRFSGRKETAAPGSFPGGKYKIWYNMGNVVIGGGLYESEIGHYRR